MIEKEINFLSGMKWMGVSLYKSSLSHKIITIDIRESVHDFSELFKIDSVNIDIFACLNLRVFDKMSNLTRI